MDTIAIVHSCYPERFGVPRQPGLVPAADAEVRLQPPYDRPEALEGLAAFSHVWLVYRFHANRGDDWKPRVRPPRLGGNQRTGVFATRSPRRPNPVGLSVVRLEEVQSDGEWCGLHISGHDLVDGTPVLDIKPYLPYSDTPADVRTPSVYAGAPAGLPVTFEPDVAAATPASDPDWRRLAEQTLGADPRPAYRGSHQDATVYGVRIRAWDVRFRVTGDGVHVLAVVSPGAHDQEESIHERS